MEKLKFFDVIKKQWLADPEIKKEYDSLYEELSEAEKIVKEGI